MTLPMQSEFSRITRSNIHESVRIVGWVNIYDSTIGRDSFVGPFVEIGGAVIGDRTYVSSHSYVCPGVVIGNDTFVAHGVQFTNDIFVDSPDWKSPVNKKFVLRKTYVGNGVRIGSGALILPVSIGDGAIIGAGAVVTRDVNPGETVVGNPSRIIDRPESEFGGECVG